MSSEKPFDLDELVEDQLQRDGVEGQQQQANFIILPVSETLPLLLLDGEDLVTDIDVDKDTEIDDSEPEEPRTARAATVPRREDDVELLLSCLKSLTATHEENLCGHETKTVMKRLKLIRLFEVSKGKMFRQLEDSIVRRAKHVSIVYVCTAQPLQQTLSGWFLGRKKGPPY
jgi:hypothetical protein